MKGHDVVHHAPSSVFHLTFTTPEHPFFTAERGWVPAADLQLDEQIWSADGSWGAVEQLALRADPQPMYNLTVATAHTYFVGEGQWLVHNSCGTWPPDLSSIYSNLEAHAKKYPPDSFKCLLYAQTMAKEFLPIAQREGFTVQIARIQYPDGFPPFILALDGRKVSERGWHEVVFLQKQGQADLFLDALTLEQKGEPVGWDSFKGLYQSSQYFYIPEFRSP